MNNHAADISDKLILKGKSNRTDIIDLVRAMLEFVGITSGQGRVRIRGKVDPVGAEDKNNTVNLNEGKGVRLAVQTSIGECFECYLNIKGIRSNHLKTLLRSELTGGCFRLPMAQVQAPTRMFHSMEEVVAASQKVSKLKTDINSVMEGLNSTEQEIVQLRILIEKAESRKANLLHLAGELIAEVNNPDFLKS